MRMHGLKEPPTPVRFPWNELQLMLVHGLKGKGLPWFIITHSCDSCVCMNYRYVLNHISNTPHLSVGRVFLMYKARPALAGRAFLFWGSSLPYLEAR